MGNYYFFLSYSRRDAAGGEYLKKFYEDLALGVGAKLGLPSSTKKTEIGFFDETGNEPGDHWPSNIAEALRTSKVFVCLYSRGYFNSTYCGREFQLFLDRVNKYKASHPELTTAPPLILPVLWDSPDRLPKLLPEIINEVQYTHSDF